MDIMRYISDYTQETNCNPLFFVFTTNRYSGDFSMELSE